jgi:hypothetical protein
LVSRDDAYATQGDQGGFFGGGNSNGQWIGRNYYPGQSWQSQSAPARGLFGLFQPWTWGRTN